MAKSKTPPGLAPGFDIKVSAEELLGKPAAIGDYLDDDSDRDLMAVLKRRQEERRALLEKNSDAVIAPNPLPPSAPAFSAPPAAEVPLTEAFVAPPVPTPSSPAVRVAPSSEMAGAPVAPLERPRVAIPPRRRLQINLSPDAERKVYELLEIIKEQGAEKHIMFNDLIHGLIYSLYEAKTDLNLSQVPARGRWGGTMAKSFPFALAQAFRDAVVRFTDRNRGTNYRNAVGS